jgi:predicted dehydrogenase
MPRLRALIVGCGRIAGGFDAARKDAAELPLTHAGAYTRDGRFEIAGCVEPDGDRRLAFMTRWGIPAGFRTIEEAKSSGIRFDVISICSPTHSHAHDLEVSLNIRPRLIFCEKPVTGSAAQTEQMIERCRKAEIPLAVNYTRRWDPSIADLKAGIEAQRWGRLRCAVGHYNKGLLNNGSHLLDLLVYLLGPLRVVKAGKPVHDYTPEDPSVPAWLEAADELPVHLVCGHAADFALFELELVFSDAVITMEEGGLFWRERRPVDSALFQGYRVLGESTRRPGGYELASLRSIDNIFRAIHEGHELASSGESAVAAQRLCEQVKQP